jgi:hypothetical protein
MWNPDASGARLAVPDAIGSLSFASVDTAPERAPVCLAVMALALLTLVAMAASGGTPAPRDEGRAFPRAETQALAQAPTAIVPGSASTVSEKTKQRVTNAYGKLPLSFVPNKGQTDKSVRYYAEGAGHAFYFTRDKAVLSFTGKDHGVALDLTPLGANRNPTLEASGRQTGKVNYLTGSEHHVNLPTYGEVRYRELWPGVDLVFRGQGAKLKYELRLRPGADPRKIRLAYQGADGLSIGAAGNLLIHTPLGTLRDSRPRSYQRIGGRRVAVRSRYALKRGEGGYGFGVGAHDPRRPLVIDPGLAYSTYLGGASEDQARGIAVDGSGSAYVTGMTFSSDFPTTAGAFETSQSGINNDAFVTKLDASGSALSYSTYLGGANEDAGFAIAVDGSGSAYVTGYTSSSNFPTTVGAFDTSHNGENDAFVTKLDASGSALSYSTYLGGELQDQAVGIAVDGSGSAYVTGATFSSLLPTTEGALDTSSNGNNDAFVTKLGASGALSYSTYLGGAGHDRGLAIAVDGSGSAYVTGSTSSSNFPTPPGALDTSSNGNDDAFVTKLGASGSALSYSTYLGGGSYEQAQGIAVDGSGSAYVTGYTSSSNFPTTAGALDTSQNGSYDAFLSKFADGRIVVVKDTQPDDPQDFSFTAGGGLLPSSFSLDDDSNPTLSNSRTFANLMPASGYSVSESVSVSSGWGLSSATCDDGSPVTNIDVSAGETVTCTFVNTPFVPNAVHTSLVPNFRQTIDNTQCQSRGGTPRLHGPPLAGPSCAPPKLLPGTSARMGSQGVGSVDIVAMPGTPGAPDDADISINASVTDVRNGSASGPAYDPVGAQDMSLVARVRISDDFNDNPSSPLNCASSTSCPATVSDFTLSAPVSCAPNGPGSDCSVTTTADGLIPDFVKENKQTSVQIFRPRLRDVGANGVFADVDDREAFMQGLYVRDVPAAPSPSYDVPQSADNIDVRFVPNYRETIDAMRCEQQGRYPGTHGAPDLTPASPGPDLSCSPPAYVPGTNARIAAATWGGLSVIPGDANPLTGDQADVSIQVHATDVRDDNGNEYTDAVGLVEKMRISDESNCTPGPGCPGTYQESGTLIDFHLPAQFFCVGTADPNVGATCSLNTTVDAVAPGVINEGKNMVLQVFRLRLSDSGQNGVIGDSDDREFAMQGVFVP